MACVPGDYDVIPSYFELLEGIYNFTVKTFHESYVDESKNIPEVKSWRAIFTYLDVLKVLLMSFICTALRQFLTKTCFKPLGAKFGLSPTNQKKMPESAFKFLYYICAWCYSLYVVILSGKYCFFQKPSIVWDGWSLDNHLPFDMYLIYIIQSGFYVHSLYATLFLDQWRKDSIVMMAHHIVTLALISFSYSLRYHNIGIVVIFLHDMCDIQLEFMKLNVYFKTQNGRLVRKHEILANLTCFCFTITWFVSRLYLYPLKVIYSSTAIVSRDNLVLPCAILMNSLLWLLQAMNVYWFLFVVGFLLRVATGQIREFDDTREYDIEEKFSQQLSAKLDSVSGSLRDTSNKQTNGLVGKDQELNGDMNLRQSGARKRIQK